MRHLNRSVKFNRDNQQGNPGGFFVMHDAQVACLVLCESFILSLFHICSLQILIIIFGQQKQIRDMRRKSQQKILEKEKNLQDLEQAVNTLKVGTNLRTVGAFNFS